MKAEDLYEFLAAEFPEQLKSENITKGRAYYWCEIRRAPASTRVLRVHHDGLGDVAEIKLAVTSRKGAPQTIVRLPVSFDELAKAVRHEVSLLSND